MKKATRAWVKKAEDDLRAATVLLAGAQPLHDQVCFHCQQLAEKYLKALLEEAALPIPKTHDCSVLLTLLPTPYRSLQRCARGLNLVTRYAVAPRYPGTSATRRQAESAIRWATKVRDACRPLLGLRK